MRKIFIISILIALIILFFLMPKEKEFNIDKNGLLHYSQNRGKVEYTKSIVEQNENFTKYLVNYKTKDGTIVGYLFIPIKKSEVGILFLPGAQVTKDNAFSVMLANLGYTVLTIDQRGMGDTKAKINSLEEDYKIFLEGKETVQQLMIYDALRAFDLLNSLKLERVIIIGESMGGRTAVIVSALDNRISKTIIFSSSGFGALKFDSSQRKFINLFDPDMYISQISPRELIMFQSKNDTVVFYNDALGIYSLAKEPKKFYSYENCNHGYCDLMYNNLKKEI